MKPESDLLEELVNRIVTEVQPLRIILFGSAARDEMCRHSDLAVLVVVSDDLDCRATAKKIYRQLRGLGCAKDIVVVRRSDVEKYQDVPSLVIHTALNEGRELYRAA